MNAKFPSAALIFVAICPSASRLLFDRRRGEADEESIIPSPEGREKSAREWRDRAYWSGQIAQVLGWARWPPWRIRKRPHPLLVGESWTQATDQGPVVRTLHAQPSLVTSGAETRVALTRRRSRGM